MKKVLTVCRCCDKIVELYPICSECVDSDFIKELKRMIENYKKIIVSCGCVTCLGNEEVILDVENLILKFEVEKGDKKQWEEKKKQRESA